jgi:hypothetical protein
MSKSRRTENTAARPSAVVMSAAIHCTVAGVESAFSAINLEAEASNA